MALKASSQFMLGSLPEAPEGGGRAQTENEMWNGAKTHGSPSWNEPFLGELGNSVFRWFSMVMAGATISFHA